jgi:hypothetical protein
LRAVAQIGDDDLGARVALLQEPRRLDRGVALVAMRADHAIDLDLELRAADTAVVITLC